MVIDGECLDDYMKNLRVKEKLCYHYFINFDEKLNKGKLSDYLKLDSHLPKKSIFICFNESSLKMMKNAF